MLLILSLLLFTSCITTPPPSPELPPRPSMEMVPAEVTTDNMEAVILELLFVLEAWEAWSDAVEELIHE